MTTSEKEALVAAWIELQKTSQDESRHNDLFWSFERLWKLVSEQPSEAFDVIKRVLASDATQTVEENLSAGPLEDLLVGHGPAFIADIESEAARDPRFRHLLGGVWGGRMVRQFSSRGWASIHRTHGPS